MARYDFWTHGSAIAVEFPNRTQEIRPAGWGTLVRQAPNTQNWFHFAIPTPTVLESDGSITLKYARLRAHVNENARIAEVHFRDDGRKISGTGTMWTDQNVNERIECPDTEIEGGLCLCVRVEFLTGDPTGQVIFRGAGARFEQ